MAVTILPLVEIVALQTGATTYFVATVPTRIDKMTVANPTGAASTVTIYLVPSGASPTAANTLVQARPVQSLETWDVWPFMGMVLAAGDSIVAKAGNNNVINFAVAGTQVT